MAKRQMPKKGFYLFTDPTCEYKELIYTTGIRGGGGHRSCGSDFNQYKQDWDHDRMHWKVLCWTCVPGKKELEERYTYYETFEEIPDKSFPTPEWTDDDNIKPQPYIPPKPDPEGLKKIIEKKFKERGFTC